MGLGWLREREKGRDREGLAPVQQGHLEGLSGLSGEQQSFEAELIKGTSTNNPSHEGGGVSEDPMRTSNKGESLEQIMVVKWRQRASNVSGIGGFLVALTSRMKPRTLTV
nr:uncharacterized protein LOC109025882 isoform X2 [Gorilla gorilla gorilla]